MLPKIYHLRTCDDAMRVAEHLHEEGYRSIIHPLDSNYIHCIEQMASHNVTGSIALRHPFKEIDTICEAANSAHIPIEVDMWQEETIDETLQVYQIIRKKTEGATLCIQSYLKRSKADLEHIHPEAVRIVKGAFDALDALKSEEAIRVNFMRLAQHCKENNISAKIATHDPALIDKCTKLYNGKEKPEFQFMYGIHTKQGEILKEKGYPVAAYLIYGTPLQMLSQITRKNLKALLRG